MDRTSPATSCSASIAAATGLRAHDASCCGSPAGSPPSPASTSRSRCSPTRPTARSSSTSSPTRCGPASATAPSTWTAAVRAQSGSRRMSRRWSPATGTSRATTAARPRCATCSPSTASRSPRRWRSGSAPASASTTSSLDDHSPSRFTNGRVGRLEENFLELTGAPLRLDTFDRPEASWEAARAGGRRRPPGAAAHRPLLPRPLRQLGPLPRPRGGARRLRRRGRLPLRHRLRGAADDPAREPRPGAPRHSTRSSRSRGTCSPCPTAEPSRATCARPRRRRSRATPSRCSSRRWASSRACRRCAASPPRSATGRRQPRTGSGARASATR